MGISPKLALAASIVWAITVLVGAFVGLPLVLGIELDAGLLISALSALGSFAAAATAVWVATSDRRQRQQEQQESDRKQAGLVRISTRWEELGTPRAFLVVTVKNFGKLPIVDVAVAEWELLGHNVPEFHSRGPLEAVLPYSGNRDTAGVLTVKPTTQREKLLIEGEPYPSGQAVIGKPLKVAPLVVPETSCGVTIQFTDAGEKCWRRSNQGLLKRLK